MSSPARLRVLVVDDDPDFRRIVEVILEQAGYAVSTARDGKEALEVFDSVRPDAMVVDVNMPAIDGLELCRRVRALERGRRIPFLLITVRSELDIFKEGVDAGATDYVIKPFEPSDLVSRLARATETCRDT